MLSILLEGVQLVFESRQACLSMVQAVKLELLIPTCISTPVLTTFGNTSRKPSGLQRTAGRVIGCVHLRHDTRFAKFLRVPSLDQGKKRTADDVVHTEPSPACSWGLGTGDFFAKASAAREHTLPREVSLRSETPSPIAAEIKSVLRKVFCSEQWLVPGNPWADPQESLSPMLLVSQSSMMIGTVASARPSSSSIPRVLHQSCGQQGQRYSSGRSNSAYSSSRARESHRAAMYVNARPSGLLEHHVQFCRSTARPQTGHTEDAKPTAMQISHHALPSPQPQTRQPPTRLQLICVAANCQHSLTAKRAQGTKNALLKSQKNIAAAGRQYSPAWLDARKPKT